jgi:NAD(P)-dependent dehydrogenase (short-subunit alcohol dehydrogenase family)
LVDLGLEGKVALITGVSQGIGLACATSLLAEGARVLGTSRSAGLAVDGLTHLQLDMTGSGAAERAVEETVARLGSLDVVVNNVGSGRLSRGFADESDAQWAEVFELNLMTAIRTTRAALPHLVQSGGVVVNVSSVNGHLPGTSIYSYSAGKAAMDNLTVGLSLEFARHGVRVVGVAPGPVSTPMWLGPEGVAATVAARTGSDPQKVVDEAIAEIPIGRFTTPEEVGDLVAFLASERAGTITGTTIRIDGGITPTV